MYQILERTIDKIQDSISEIRHYSKNAEDGKIYRLANGKWAFNNYYGKETYFSCGYPIEIFSEKENEWNSGRIEHTDGEYYFYNYDGDNLKLYKDMRVRIRIGNL